MQEAYLLFDTALGHCGIAWNDRGITCVQLPEATVQDTEQRMVARDARPAAAPPEHVRVAIGHLVRHLGGAPQDLSGLPLDLSGQAPFARRVYEGARAIAAGDRTTYGALAARIGAPGAARAVGQALARNPWALVVPCHRVLAADGQLRGFSANGGVALKQRLLAMEEGAGAAPAGSLFHGDAALPFDPDLALRTVVAADPVLARLVGRVGPFRLQLEAMKSPYEALAEAIVYQQLTGKAAATILGRVCALSGGRLPAPAALLALDDEGLRGAGLSRGKVAALRDLAAKTQEGVVPSLAVLHTLDDQAIIDRLVTIRGVGRWTVEMLLIFRLGRPDVLPAHDYGLLKGYALAFRPRNHPQPADLVQRGERWRPYRTVACWYLWRAAELPALRR